MPTGKRMSIADCSASSPAVERHDRLGRGAERAALALGVTQFAVGGEEEQTEDHVLGRHRHRTAVGGLEDVVRGQHQDAGLGLRLRGERQVDGHLVTVEVRVERGADERVDLDGLALDELRLEGLDAEAVQGGRTVQQHRVLGDDLFEDVVHDGAAALHHALGALDVLRVVQVDQALHHERLEELQRHRLRQTALVQLELRTDDDHGTRGVVHTLAEQVLTESTLLALEHVAQGLQRAVTGTGDRTATTAVVEQRVDGLLEHALLVVHDDLGRAEVEKPLQAVVAVDHTAVQVVQVGGREAATVQLHHRAKVRRDDRHAVQHHALGAVAGLQERGDDLEALERTGLLLALAGADDLAEALGLLVQVEGLEPPLQGGGAHRTVEVRAEAVTQLAVEELVALQVLDLEVLEAGPHLVEAVDLALRTVAQLLHLPLGAFAHLAAHVGLGALGLELGQVGLELLGAGLEVGVATVLDLLTLDGDMRLQRGQVARPALVVDERDHVRREVDDLLEVLRSEVEQVPEA